MKEISDIAERLRTQNNRMTQNPMFCVQIKVCDIGYDTSYSDRTCWHDSANGETIYDDHKDFVEAPEGDQWDGFGYVDRWETVMVSFTEVGCQQYIDENGHNLRHKAHNGEIRIYAESFNRCQEMVSIRAYLMGLR